ncbi:SLC13 family permease [Pyxidicoccus trucidator]|uniref:SLC13 family permease n=1 Tax=Pyxidicoccus trucidator TaxID=2709662 RepID=UPI0013DB5178|nr:SLC13 family permease [Pyxidicoccus trucidator]
MQSEITLVLAIVLATIVLFSVERIPLEVTSLAVVCLLGLTGVLTPAEAFAGFSNETVIFIFALLAMTEGLASTGVMRRAGLWLSHLGRLGPKGFLLGVMLLVAVFSAFVSNTVTTAAFLPVVLRGAKSVGLRRSWVLMPLAFASMLGGMGFLYGTSTNLVVSARLEDLGFGPIGLVELSPAGVPLAVLGIALVILLAPRVLPARAGTAVAPAPHPKPDGDVPLRPRRSRALLASLIFVTTLGVGSSGVVSLSLAGVAGVLLMVVTGCLDAKRVFHIDWRVVLLIGSMMALGLAMEKSGAGKLLGGFASELAEVGGPRLVLLCLMLLTVFLSIPMSNQAAALVVLPVGLSAATGLGVDPRGFAMGIALAASCSFLTPLEPSCMLVYGPGRYRFSDFLRLGGPLTALMLAALVLLVPWVWPLDAGQVKQGPSVAGHPGRLPQSGCQTVLAHYTVWNGGGGPMALPLCERPHGPRDVSPGEL